METMILILNKQKQLLEMELYDYIHAKEKGIPSLHPDLYYAKIAHAYKGIVTAIKMLTLSQDDIYSNFEHIEQ